MAVKRLLISDFLGDKFPRNVRRKRRRRRSRRRRRKFGKFASKLQTKLTGYIRN